MPARLKGAHFEHLGIVIGPDINPQVTEQGRLALVLVNAKKRGVATPLHNLNPNLGQANNKFTSVTGFIIRKQSK